MSVTASGLYLINWAAMSNATQLAFAPLADTLKIGLLSDSATPNFTTDDEWSDISANEVSGGSWSAGGYTLTTPAVDISSRAGCVVYDWADVSQVTTDLTAAMAGVIYDTTLATNKLICLVDFVNPVTTVNGTFQITWATPANGGAFYFDLTP